jgi:hypothetical protein
VGTDIDRDVRLRQGGQDRPKFCALVKISRFQSAVDETPFRRQRHTDKLRAERYRTLRYAALKFWQNTTTAGSLAQPRQALAMHGEIGGAKRPALWLPWAEHRRAL